MAIARFYSDGSLVQKMQSLIADMSVKGIFIDICAIDARPIALDYDPGTLDDYSKLGAPNVCLIAGRMLPVLSHPQFELGFADVGAFLGSLCVRDAAECVASIDIVNKPTGRKADANYPLRYDGASWTDAGCSVGGCSFAEMSDTQKNEMDDKHIIYAGQYFGYPGMYWSSSKTCTSDADDFCRIERNSAWNVAARGLVTALTSKIKSKIPLNPDGTIRRTTITYWSGLAEQNLKAMKDSELISDYKVYIDPAQKVLSGVPISVQLTIVPIGIADSITGTVGFSTSI